MQKRFSELAIGQTFTDGDFTIMKLRGNHARCVETDNLATLDPDEIVSANNDAPTLHDSPTEIERAAITLLLNFGAHHPLLDQWITQMARDPDEFRYLDDYARAEHADAFQGLAHDAWAIPGTTWREHLAGKIMDWKAHPLDDDQHRGEQRRANQHDRTTYLLADAVREYRYMGRPDGDQSHLIHGMGGPLLRVTTSLAASLVEYVDSIVSHAWGK